MTDLVLCGMQLCERLGVGRSRDAPLGDNGVDEPRRGYVEGGAVDFDALRRCSFPEFFSYFIRSSLLDRYQIASGETHIKG